MIWSLLFYGRRYIRVCVSRNLCLKIRLIFYHKTKAFDCQHLFHRPVDVDKHAFSTNQEPSLCLHQTINFFYFYFLTMYNKYMFNYLYWSVFFFFLLARLWRVSVLARSQECFCCGACKVRRLRLVKSECVCVTWRRADKLSMRQIAKAREKHKRTKNKRN